MIFKRCNARFCCGVAKEWGDSQEISIDGDFADARAMMPMQIDRFSREITAVGERMRDRVGPADLNHLRRASAFGRAWWMVEDWIHTHNRIHHRHAQAPEDADVMDTTFLAHRPMWLRVFCFAVLAMSWKFAYHAPRLCKDCTSLGVRHGVSLRDFVNLSEPVSAGLWAGGFLPYVGVRFLLPVLLVAPVSAWAAGNLLANLLAAELVHNVHTFVCIRPSHRGGDIPLFAASARTLPERHLQAVLETTNYRAGGDLHDLLHGWQSYQVEHHVWPAATLLQCRRARAELVAICGATSVPNAAATLGTRVVKMCRLFLGLDGQRSIDTGHYRTHTQLEAYP